MKMLRNAMFFVAAITLGMTFGIPAHSTQAATISSTRTGNWSDPSMWSSKAVPRAGESVTISSGHTVTYDALSNNVLGAIHIEGVLKFSRTANTRLKLSDNLMVMMGGFLDMGTQNDFIPKPIKAEIIFVLTQAQADAYVGGPAFQATDKGLWVMTGGRWEVHGAPLLRTWSKLAGDAPAQATTVTVQNNVTDWYVGGTVIITQTSNPLPTHPEQVVLENEIRNITSVESLPGGKTRLTVNKPLSFSHQGAGQERGEAGLLTRNILITTDITGVDESTLESSQLVSNRNGRKFAHTMFMYGASGNVQYTEFKYMGHFRALGRYPVHYHQMFDTSREMVIKGNGVWFSGNRAYTVHDSNGMLGEDNVAFNTVSSPYFIEHTTSNPLPPQDNTLSHNLGVESIPALLPTEPYIPDVRTDVAIFWFDQFFYQTVVGNVAVGAWTMSGPGGRSSGFQLEEHSAFVVPGKPMYFVFRKNEAHSNRSYGMFTWIAPREPPFDMVEFHVWRNGVTGLFSGSYFAPYHWMNIRSVENGAHQIDIRGVKFHLQDSELLGGGNDWTKNPLNKAVIDSISSGVDTGINAQAYVASQAPDWPARVIRTVFQNNPTDVTQDHVACTGSDIVLQTAGVPVPSKGCTSNYMEHIGNTYSGTAKALDFGWQQNKNAWWKVFDYTGPGGLPKNFFLLRKDQLDPANQTNMTKQLVNAQTFYSPEVDALVTLMESLPAGQMTLTGLHYHLAGGLTQVSLDVPTPTAPDYPPQVSLDVTMNGKVATLRANVTDDKNVQKVEFWQDENLIKTMTPSSQTSTSSFETTLDLTSSKRGYAYFYAKAYDGYVYTPVIPEGQIPYVQSAYSKVVELGPEVLAAKQPLPAPATNKAPAINAGQQLTITLPASANLSGTVSDDGLPNPPAAVTLTWSKVSGPGTVVFADAKLLATTAIFSLPGTYLCRLTANDGQLSASGDVTITVNQANQAPAVTANQAPSVNAGPNQTIDLPAAASLLGTVTDDGLPNPPAAVTLTWSMVSGPGAVVFANANLAATTASFSQGGTYVLRLTAGDGQLSASKDVTITVNPAYQAPAVNAPYQAPAVNPAYQAPAVNAANQAPVVKPANQAPVVNAGPGQTIALPAAASLLGTVMDDGLPNPPVSLTVTWRKVTGPGGVVFANPNSVATTASFSQSGTYVLRLTANDGQLSAYKDLTITVSAANQAPVVKRANQAPVVKAGPGQTIALPATASLLGTVTDDGLPNPPASLTVTWRKVTGPGVVVFANPNSVATAASFSRSGTYVLRLTANDGQLSAPKNLTITVKPAKQAPSVTANQAPSVNAGPGQTITLPATARLLGTVTDDGLPNPPASLTATWGRITGPSVVVFANPNSVATTASFSKSGTYVLRLTASDGQLSASKDVRIRVNCAKPCQPPGMIQRLLGWIAKLLGAL